MFSYISARRILPKGRLTFGIVTLGNVFSSSLGGLLFDVFPVRQTLLIGAAFSFLGMLFCLIFTERDKR